MVPLVLACFGAAHHEASNMKYILIPITENTCLAWTQLVPSSTNANIAGPLLIAGGGTPKVRSYSLSIVEVERARRVDACAADLSRWEIVLRTARRLPPLGWMVDLADSASTADVSCVDSIELLLFSNISFAS